MIRYGVLLALLLLAGCGSMPEKVKIAGCLFANSEDMAPSWVCDSRYEGLLLAETGVSAKLVGGPAVMRSAAAAEAREKLAAVIQQHLQRVLTTSLDTAVTVELFDRMFEGLISGETLLGARLYTSRSAPDGSLYVLVGFEEGALAAMLNQVILRSMQQRAELWSLSVDEPAQQALADKVVQQFLVELK